MQSIRTLENTLFQLAGPEHYLFTNLDLAAILPDLNNSALNALLGRAHENGIIQRICRGLYLNPRTDYPAGLVLYHAAARLRANEFNYLSLESVLSDAGVISQIPMNWITLMSSGRNYIYDCGLFGHIEFIHTKKDMESIPSQLQYDPRTRLWRSSVKQAIKDMRLTRRSTDLVDWEVADEFV